MGKMNYSIQNLKDYVEKVKAGKTAKYVSVFLAVFLISALVSFTYQGQDRETDSISFSGEINGSENEMILEFFNETVEITMEKSDKSRFYIDMDSDGSADIRLDKLTHDGNARKDSVMLDYRSGVYLFEFRYSEDANRTDDGWLRPLKITRLG